MKKSEIQVGKRYVAKVSGKLTTVRVDAIRERFDHKDKSTTVYDVTNLSTNRKTTFRSAAKFRQPARTPAANPPHPAAGPAVNVRNANEEPATSGVEPRPDPTASDALAADSLRSSGQDNVDGVGAAEKRGSGSALSACLSAADLSGPTPPHLIVQALAGTGKTTTLIEGLRCMRGMATSITPSPQQQAVWDQLSLSKAARSVCFVAFNKSIAEELKRRVPPGCEAMTMHSMGFRAVRNALGRQEPNSFVVQDHLAAEMGQDARELKKREPVLVKAVEELVSLCKQNMAGCLWGDPNEPMDATDLDWPGDLCRLADRHDIDLGGNSDRVFNLVPRVLERCKAPQGKISFDDMIWLPIVLDLPVFQHDLLLVDEVQDLNRCQQALAKRAGKRLILVGDSHQAIYGFAGADSESMARMEKELSASSNGCVVLPLTVTRRCGKAIVAEARRYVPEFEAHESNGGGRISRYTLDKREMPGLGTEYPDGHCAGGYRSVVADADFVLCRCNAPLVSECFRFLKAGRKATIQGRDVGQGLVGTVKKICGKDADLAAVPVVRFIELLDDWHAAEAGKERAKRSPSEAKLEALEDRRSCLECFADGARTAADVVRKIETVFTDDKASPGIRLSSIHRAKGLESRRVFLLVGDGRRTFGPPEEKLQAWERVQENNLRYVAITRAIEELVYVS